MKTAEVEIAFHTDADATMIAKLVQAAGEFESSLYISHEDKHINAKSIMGMLNLSLSAGDYVTLSADGPDEDKALEVMKQLLEAC